MKNLILMLSLFSAGTVLSAQFESWEEHTLAAMEARLEQANRGGGTIVTVGSDTACDFRLGTTKIQDAIDTKPEEIRIATGIYTENLIIDDISITLIGGYANCTDAANNVPDGEIVIINGNTSAPVMRILGNTRRNTVNLTNMLLQDGNGTGSGFFTAGGISTLAADVQLNLTKVIIANNVGLFGGGIAIVGGNTDISAVNTLVASNTAEQGGGIYCSSPDASVLMSETDAQQSGVFGNTASDGDGGGVLLDFGCVMTTYSGTSGNLLDFRGIATNQATESGGGIAVKGGSSANLIGFEFCLLGCVGNNDEPLNITNNVANSNDDGLGFGGGVFVTGAGSSVLIMNGLVADNAAESGGAIAVRDQGIFETSYRDENCWSRGRCSQYNDNRSNIFGGAMYIDSAGKAKVTKTYFQGNRADLGVIGYIFDPDSLLDMESSVVVHNGATGADGFDDFYLFRTIEAGTLRLNFSTIADNALFNDIISSPVFGNAGGIIGLFNSIVHDPGTDLYAEESGSTFSALCNIVNEDNSLPSGTEILVADPVFINRLEDDYHINAATSPAVDLCAAGNMLPSSQDIDSEDFGYDDPTVVNASGPFDAGADETYSNDIILASGFDRPTVLTE